MKRMVGLAAVCLGLLGAPAGLLWAPPAGAGESIKLGAVVPLTGRYGGLGAQVKPGYEIAVETINRAGGVTVGGRKLLLELIVVDDESDPTKIVARMETLAPQGVAAYLGSAGSDMHAAAAARRTRFRTAAWPSPSTRSTRRAIGISSRRSSSRPTSPRRHSRC